MPRSPLHFRKKPAAHDGGSAAARLKFATALAGTVRRRLGRARF
jgi:hypothetical protein